MFKKIFSGVLAMVMVISLCSSVLAEENITVKLDDTVMEFEAQPQMINDRTMVPFWEIFEAMGALVAYNVDTQTVSARKSFCTVEATIGKEIIVVNGEEKEIDVAPVIMDDIVFVPVRFIAEAFNSTVEWDGETNTVIITSGELGDNKEYSQKVGNVAFGYFWHPNSSNNEYPDYIKEEVAESVETIKKLQNENTVSFAFATDLHYSKSANHDVRTKRMTNAYKYIAEKTGIDMFILGGDYVNDGTKEYKLNNYTELVKHLDGINYFPVNGNHDDNSIWDAYLGADKSVNHLTAAELYDTFYSHLEKTDVEFDEENKGLYYMLDDAESKVRYIFLDAYDMEEIYDDNGLLLYKKQYLSAFSQKQIDWFVNKALSFDEEGWSIVLVSHSVVLPGKTAAESEHIGLLNEILSAYRAGEKLQAKYNEGYFEVSVDADFEETKRGEIVGVFAGHSHNDVCVTDEYNIPYINTGSAIMYKDNGLRTDGDKTEMLFDVITIDKEKQIIYMTRVGAGEDREVSYSYPK